MLNQKDKGKMLGVMLGFSDHKDESEQEGITAAKAMAEALGISLSDEKAKQFYDALELAQLAFSRADQSEGEESDPASIFSDESSGQS